MEKPELEEYNQTVQEVLAAWCEYAIRMLTEQLKKKKMVITADLEKSLKTEVSKIVNGGGYVSLNFNLYGRYRDMKKLTYSGPANFDEMLAWVKGKGIAAFKYIPGYDPAKRNVLRIPTTNSAMNRIAWGVAWSRYTKFKHRRKQWFNKYFYGPVVGHLIDGLIAATGTSAVQVVERDLEKAMSGDLK